MREGERACEGCQKSFSCMGGSHLSPFSFFSSFHLGALETEMIVLTEMRALALKRIQTQGAGFEPLDALVHKERSISAENVRW